MPPACFPHALRRARHADGRWADAGHRLFALQLGSTAIGIQVPDGVLLAVEKRITSPLLEPDSIEKIMEIDSHMGCSMSGLTADARTLIDHARIETQNHRFTYDAPMTIEATTQSICDLALGFGEGENSRL